VNNSARMVNALSLAIRTRISGVIGTADLLLASPDAGNRPEELLRIRGAGEGVLELIESVERYVQIQEGIELQPECCVLQRFVDEIVAEFQPTAGMREVQLSAVVEQGVAAAVLADVRSLRDVLRTLLSNAVKSTRMGTVTVSVANEDGQIRFAVADSGLGIPRAKIARLFEPFWESTDSSYAPRRTGLSLPVSALLVRSMGGELAVESRLLRGSTFHFSLQLPVFSGTIPEALPPTAQRGNRRILVVDDNAMNRMLAIAMLEKLGIEADEAEDGVAAMKVLAEMPERYMLVLMDVEMPRLNGLKATTLLRQQGFNKPIVALTAHALVEDRARCIEAGMSSVMTKPVRLERLRTMLNRLSMIAQPQHLDVPIRGEGTPMPGDVTRVDTAAPKALV